MNPHGPEHEEWIRAIATGEESLDGDEARARIEECAECRKEIEGLMTMQQELRAAARMRRRVLDRADRSDEGLTETQADWLRARLSGEGDDRTTAIDDPAPSEEPPRPSIRRSSRPFRFLLATAAAAIITVGLWQTGLIDGTRNVPLGDGILELLTPRGDAETPLTFEWSSDEFPAAGYYLLIVEPSNAPAVEVRLEEWETTWRPADEASAAWRTLSWRVEVYDSNNALVRESKPVSVEIIDR